MSHLSRRSFTLGLAAVAAASGASAAQPASLAFAAIRNGRRIGEHRLTFERAGDDLTVRVRAEMAVKVGPVTVYRYLHEVEERWRGGRFEQLTSRTNSGGKRESVEAIRTSSGVVIRAGDTRVQAPLAALPMTHWNPAIVRAPLFNPQTGKLLRLSVRELGPARAALADGRVVPARRVAFSGDAQIDNWYDEAGVWTALRGRLDDGSTMEYRRL